jgi:hypothetical protein
MLPSAGKTTAANQWRCVLCRMAGGGPIRIREGTRGGIYREAL